MDHGGGLQAIVNLLCHSYTIALRQSISANEAQTLHQNRAMANLRLDCFDAALADASHSLQGETKSEKALYRAAMALYGLRRYEESRAVLETLLETYTDSVAARDRLVLVQQRLREQATGDFDFKGMHEQVRSGPRHLDIATYSKPVIVKESPGKGLGLFTVEAVKAGTPLLCEKAFSYCAAAEKEPGETTASALVNLHANSVIFGTQPDLITSIVQKTFRNPSLAPVVADLHCGSYERVQVDGPVDGQPVIDT